MFAYKYHNFGLRILSHKHKYTKLLQTFGKYHHFDKETLHTLEYLFIKNIY